MSHEDEIRKVVNEPQVREYVGKEDSSYFKGIGWAVNQLLKGKRVKRRAWYGDGKMLGSQFPGLPPGSEFKTENTVIYAYLITENNQRVPWTCTQDDLFATDWEVVL